MVQQYVKKNTPYRTVTPNSIVHTQTPAFLPLQYHESLELLSASFLPAIAARECASISNPFLRRSTYRHGTLRYVLLSLRAGG